MLNISKLIKDHPNYTYALGAAIVGYMGYHVIKWVMSKCSQSEENVVIVDAKDSGMERKDVAKAIEKIAKNELGRLDPILFLTEDYFNNKSIALGWHSPQNILLAKKGKEIIGFLIIEKGSEKDDGFFFGEDTLGIAFLAVDSNSKRKGIGTKLMLEAVKQTKALDKHYLIFTHLIATPKSDGKKKIDNRQAFFDNFAKKFQIPLSKIEKNFRISRDEYSQFSYDLQNFEVQKN